MFAAGAVAGLDLGERTQGVGTRLTAEANPIPWLAKCQAHRQAG